MTSMTIALLNTAILTNTVINVVVFKETTNSVATMSGLCPLLQQQEFPSRPQGLAIEQDEAVFEVYDTAPLTDVC